MPTFKIDYYEGQDKRTLKGQTGDRVVSMVSALVDDPTIRGILIFKED